MTKYRKKRNPRIRRCKILLSIACKPLFHTEKKRPHSCEECKKELSNKGLNIENYLKKREEYK